MLADLFLRDAIVWKVFTTRTICSPVASVWMYLAACACSVSIIRQLYHSKGRDIIACFLFHWAQSSLNCESIHCCLGYMFPLVFSASKNNAEKSELRGSPYRYESTVGTQCKASSRKKKKMNGRMLKNKKKLTVVTLSALVLIARHLRSQRLFQIPRSVIQSVMRLRLG